MLPAGYFDELWRYERLGSRQDTASRSRPALIATGTSRLGDFSVSPPIPGLPGPNTLSLSRETGS